MYWYGCSAGAINSSGRLRTRMASARSRCGEENSELGSEGRQRKHPHDWYALSDVRAIGPFTSVLDSS